MELPLKSISVRYKQEVCLVIELKDSSDHLIMVNVQGSSSVKGKLRRYKVQNAIARLQHKEVEGETQAAKAIVQIRWGARPI